LIETTPAPPTPVIQTTTPVTKKRPKKKPKIDSDDDELKENAKRFESRKASRPVPKSLVKFCLRCSRRFISADETTECLACSGIQGSTSKSSKVLKKELKRKERLAFSLTGRTNLKVLPLKEQCINFIASRIDQVDKLSFLPRHTRRLISKILSTERKLDGIILDIFLDQSESFLELFDCTR
jgi:hypothetical protein